MKNDKDLKFGRINKLFNLKDRVIVLTGSAGLLGTQYAQILSDAGATLILIDTNARKNKKLENTCLLYTSPSPRDRQKSRMPSSA